MGIKQPNGAHIELFQRRARKHALKKSSESYSGSSLDNMRMVSNGYCAWNSRRSGPGSFVAIPGIRRAPLG